VSGPQLFISDLHLTIERPAISQTFFAFLLAEARAASDLYILGDLFDYWIGDDDLDDPFNASIANALRALSAAGCRVSFMPGNRDFLLGSRFAAVCGMTVLDDPSVIDLHGVRTLLMHGDTLCTTDLAYQEFRTKVHTGSWQRDFLARTLSERRAIAQGLRAESQAEKGTKTSEIMDVTPSAVEQVMRDHACTRLIHGHTHRPARHALRIDGRPCERWVLASWYETGSYLRCDPSGNVAEVTLAGA
jgi:UDP-2,3-diacylglucosamine hydrolase